MASNMRDLERLLQKGRKSSRRVPVKAGSWLSNAMKSVGYSSMDILNDMMPNTVALGQSAAQSATDIKDSIRNLGSQRGKLKSAFNGSIYGQLTKEAIQNTIADFKSGDFYNRSRELEYAEKAMTSDDDDFDFGFDDDFDDTEDFDANLDSDDDGASVSINRSHKGRNEATRITLVNNIGPDSAIVKATELQTQVTAKGVGILVDAGKANTQVSLAIMNRIGSDVNRGMTVINQTISDTGTTIASSIDKFSAISGKYYDDSLALYTRMADSLDIIKQQTAVGAAASAIRDAKDVPNVLDMFSGGTISISDYKKFVRKNFGNWVDNSFVASQVKNMLEDTDTLGSIIQSPLRSIAKNIAEQFIPNMVQRSMKEFDRSVGEFAVTALTKLGSQEDSSNPIISALASIFGIRNKMNTRVDKRNYEKGAVPFDGITHRTINDVIPTYLRQIASALTGKEEFAFDYNEGVYRSLSEIKEKHKSDLEYEKLSPFSTDISQFNEMLSKTYTAATKEQLSAIENDFKTFLSKMVDVGGIPNYRKKAGRGDFGEITDYISELLDMPNDRRSADIIRNALEGRYKAGLGSENIRMFGRSVQEARNNVSRMTAEREANQLKYNDNLIDNGLESFDNATMRLKRKGYYGNTRVSDSRGPLADKYGHKPTYYLREILKTLTGGISVNVIGSTSPNNGSSPSDLYTSLIDEEQNQFRRERAIVNTTSEATRIKDLDGGKLDLDSDVDFNDETMTANSQRYFSGVVDEERGTRKKSIFEKFSNAPGTIGKWMRGISATINKSSAIAQTSLNTANEFIYTILFGNEKGRKGLGAAFDYIWAGMKLQFKKVGTFVNDRILKPIDDLLFGDNGIVTKLKQSEVFKGFKDKASKVKDRISGALFGKKIENPDGTTGYEGGLLSNTLNELKDVGTRVKESIVGKKGPDGKSLPIEKDNSVFGNLKKIGLRISDSIYTTLGLDDKGKGGGRLSIREAAATGLKSVWSHTKNRFDEWTDLLLGERTKGDKINTVKDGVTSFANEMKGKSGKLGAGAVLGAVGTGLLSGKLGILGSIFLPGGPIGGALLGTGIAMITQSNTLKDKLFGPTDADGKRTGGIISKEIIDFVSDNKTGIKLGAFAGLASSFGLLPAMFFPGGPIGGALAGGAISLAHKAGLFNTMLYGVDGDKNNPTGGLTKKFKDIFGKSKNLKGLALDASMGAGLGIMGSFFLPGGPIVGAMLGSAASIAMNTEKFKSMLFGNVNEETGKREGGLFGRFKGYMDKKIFNPLAKTIETAQADFMFFVKDKMVRPLASAIAPITNKFTEAGEYVASSFKDMVSGIGKKFYDTVTKPLGDTIDKWIITPLKKIATGIFGMVTRVIGSIISAPFRAIGWIGQSIFASDKRRGANEASVERSKQAWGDAKTAFATSRENAGGGVKGLFSGLWSGAKALGSGNIAAFSKETREAGRWGWRGAGRYATPDKNPKSIDNQLKEQYASEHERRLAEINAKYSDGNWKKKQSKLNKAKPGTIAGVQSEVSNLSEPLDKIDNNTTTSADEATKISSKIDTVINNENDHSSKTNNLLDNIKNILSGISTKIKASTFGDSDGEEYELGQGSIPNKKASKNKAPRVNRTKLSRPITFSSSTNGKYESSESSTSDYESIGFNDGSRKNQKAQTKIASNVSDIADSVHGQLNGVGSNVNKIYRLLLKHFGERDEDIKGDNNKTYQGFFGKLRTKFNRPLKALKGLTLAPFIAVRDIGFGMFESVKNAAGSIVRGATSFATGVGKAALSILEIPVNITRLMVNITKMIGPAIGNALFQTVKLVGDGLHLAATTLISGVASIGRTMFNAAKGFGEFVGTTLAGVGNLLWGAGKLGGRVLGGAGKVLQGGAGLLGGLLGGAGSALFGIGSAIGSRVGGAINSVKMRMLKSKAKPVYVVGGVLDQVRVVDDVTHVNGFGDKSVKLFEKMALLASGKLGTAVGRGGSGSQPMNLTLFGNTGKKIKEENELTTRIAENSEDAIRAKQAVDDKAAQDAEYRTKVTTALSNLNTTTETHHSVWSSIFGLKGILTGALILLAPLIIKNFSKIAGWIGNAVAKAVPAIVKTLANSLRSIFYKNSGSGNGFELGKNGTVVLDENGVPSIAETGDTSALGSIGNLIMPKRTIIDSRTGKAHNVREWTHLSGAMVNATRGKASKLAKKGIKLYNVAKGSKAAKWAGSAIASGKSIVGQGKAWQTAYSSLKAAGVDNAAKYATDTIGGGRLGKVMTMANTGAESLTKIAGKAKDKVVTAAKSNGTISKFIDLAKEAVSFLKTKIDDFLLKHNSKMGGKLAQWLGKMTTSLSEKVVSKFGPKITSVMAKLSTAASTLLLSDVAWGALGALNANPAQVFQVNKKDVDWKMQLIARFWKGIMSTSFFSIIDLVIQIVSSLLGFDLGSELCVQMYKLISSDKKDAKLDASREKFKEEYDTYSQEEYAAYVENAKKNGESYMSYEEFMQSGLGTKFEDYNARENRTVVKKVMDGASVVGGGIVKGAKAVVTAPVKLAKAVGSGIKSAGTGVASAFKNAFTGAKDPASKVMGILSGKDSSGSMAQDAADAVVSATLAPLNFVTSGLRNALGFVSKSMGDMDKVSKDVDDAADVFATDVNGNNYFKSKAKTNTFSGLVSNMMFSVLRGTMSPLFFLKTGLSGDKNKTSIFGKLKNAGSWLLDKLGFGKKTNVDETGGSGGFGGDVYFSQNDPRIANAPYKLSDGRYDTMGNRGCGPTAMAMVANSVGGRGLDPLSMANDATKAGFSTDVGTTPGFFDYEANKLGIGSSRMPASKSNISTSLSSGNPVIIQGSDTNPNSPFTPQGHYVVGTKVDGDRVAIKDPRGPQYSGLYDINTVTSGASNMWSFGGKGGVTGIRYGRKRKGGFGGLTAEAVVKVAAGEIGYIEKASNSQLDDKTANPGDANYTKYGVVTGTNGDYWCASFVCWCFMQAAGSKQAATAALCGGFSAACNSMMNAFKTAQRFDKTPRVGDCIFFVGTRHGGANHIGIVCGIDDQNVYTIEGNTSGGSTVVDNGGCVAAKQYPLNYAKILGYGHPVFDTAVSSTFNGLTDLSKGNTNGTTTVSTNNTGTSTSSNTLSTGGIASIGEFLSGYANAFMSPLLKSFGFNTDDSIDSTSTDVSSTVSTNGTGTSDITYSAGDDYIGKYVRKYESGSKGSAMISSGTGDHGGVSFGTYQFPSNRQSVTESGNLPAFWNKYYASQYPGVKPGDNDAFKKAWLDAVNKDPEAFSKREHEFIASKYYTPISAALKTNGVGDPTSYDRGAQEAAWSSAVQYGPTKAAGLFKDSGVNTSMDPKTFITKLYDYKQANVPMNFKSSSTSVQKSIVQRFGNEKNDLLQLAGNKPIQPSSGGMGGMGGYPMAKYKQMTLGGYGTSVKGLATPNYTKAPILGGFGGAWDTASVSRVIALLERIAGDMTSTSEGIDSLNSKDFTSSSYSNNSKSTTNHNTVNAADKSANVPVNGKDRSGYALAKQLAKGTFAFS